MTVVKVCAAAVLTLLLLISIFESACAFEDHDKKGAITYYAVSLVCGLTLAVMVAT
jgi:hypothetical protein